MKQPVTVDRKLPPHELNARRNRKRALTHLPAIASLPDVREFSKADRSSSNVHVLNPATNPADTSKP